MIIGNEIKLYEMDDKINKKDYREFSDNLYVKILNSVLPFDLKRQQLALLHRWVRIKQIEELNSTDRMKKIISDIADNNFYVDNQFIRYTNLINITTIFDETNNLITLSDNVIKQLIDEGYGISEFFLERMHIIKEVWCYGKHPNLNSLDHTFCIDREFKESSLTLENMLFLKEMFSIVNMKSMYPDDKFKSIIRSH